MKRSPPRFRNVLRRGFAITAALDPLPWSGPAGLLAGARDLRNRVDAVVVTGGEPAAPVSPSATAGLVRARGVDAVADLSRPEGDLYRLQAELLGAAAAGVDNLIVPDAAFVRIVAALNRGEDAGGRPLGGRTDFFIGVAAGPAPAGETALRAAIEAGAHFFLTPPVFEARETEAFLAISGRDVPVVATVRPTASGRPLPCPDPERRREGLRFCREVVASLRSRVAGVHLDTGGDAGLVLEILGEEETPAPADTPLLAALREAAAGGRLPCRRAWDLARERGVSVEEAGRALRELGIKITGCRLGCF